MAERVATGEVASSRQMAPTPRTSFRLPAELLAATRAEAKRRGVTLTDAAIEAFQAWVRGGQSSAVLDQPKPFRAPAIHVQLSQGGSRQVEPRWKQPRR